jgi:hypothetical protein
MAKSVLLSINIRILEWMLHLATKHPVIAIPCRYNLPLTMQKKNTRTRGCDDFRLITNHFLPSQTSTKLSKLLRLLAQQQLVSDDFFITWLLLSSRTYRNILLREDFDGERYKYRIRLTSCVYECLSRELVNKCTVFWSIAFCCDVKLWF